MTFKFHGFDLIALARWMLFYEVAYQWLGFVWKNNGHQKIRKYGNSYSCALVNAVIVSFLGAANTKALWKAPEFVKAIGVFDHGEPWCNETQVSVSFTELAVMDSV